MGCLFVNFRSKVCRSWLFQKVNLSSKGDMFLKSGAFDQWWYVLLHLKKTVGLEAGYGLT